MKFNLATLYKVPFDNSYRDVVDYYTLTDTSATPTKRVFGKDPLTSASIKNARDKFFANRLDSRVVYTSNSVYKSVKVIGNNIECSVVGGYNDICDFNYIVFSDTISNPEKQLYCFVTNITSNNDNTVTKSCTITCEIDFWTNYVDSIEMTTRKQFETFAHDKTNIFNGKFDDRLPSEFTYTNTLSNMFNDYIIFARVVADARWGLDFIGNSFDASAIGFQIKYIPLYYVHNGTFNYIKGITDNNTQWGGYFEESFYTIMDASSEYVYDLSLTPFTPYGIFGLSYVSLINGNYYFNVNTVTITSGKGRCHIVDTVDDTNYFEGAFEWGSNPDIMTFPLCIGLSHKPHKNPILNREVSKTIIESYTKDKSISSDYAFGKEIKFYQSPFKKYVLFYNGAQYDISPSPVGTTANLVSTLKFKRLANLTLSVEHNNDVGSTYYLKLNDAGQIQCSKDKLEAYKQQAMEADRMKLYVGQLGSIASTVAGLASGNAGLAIGGAAGLLATSANYHSNVIRATNAPDNLNAPSNNMYDTFNTIAPLLLTKTLYQEDVKAVGSIWQHFGYPIHEERDFSVKRFYYDYKQIKNPIFPNITNPLARKKIEQIFANGVTIWHYNRLDRDHDYFQFGNYSINNPDWDGAEEEIQ